MLLLEEHIERVELLVSLDWLPHLFSPRFLLEDCALMETTCIVESEVLECFHELLFGWWR